MSVFGADTPATGTYTDEQFERGEALYTQQCAQCHGAELDERGGTGTNRPDVQKDLGADGGERGRAL